MEREQVEDEIRRLCGARDYRVAATLLLREYGSEILSLLCSRLRSEVNGREVFGMFCEDLWRALPAFEFRCSSRTWAYVLARHAEIRFRSEPQRRPDRNLPFFEQLEQVIERGRTSTAPYRRTIVQEAFRKLRERLSEQDELVLVLRVDRALSWHEIARVFLPSGAAAGDAVVQREAARLRQRFQGIKQRLRQWAQEEGLLQAPGSTAREFQPSELERHAVPSSAPLLEQRSFE